MSEFWRVNTHAFLTQPEHGPSRLARRPSWGKNLAVASSIQNDGGCRGQGGRDVLCAQGLHGNIGVGSSIGWRWGGHAAAPAHRLPGECKRRTRASPSQPVGWDGAGFRTSQGWLVAQSPSSCPDPRDRLLPGIAAPLSTLGCADDMQSSVICLLSCRQAGKHCCKLPNAGLWVVRGDPTLRPVSSGLSPCLASNCPEDGEDGRQLWFFPLRSGNFPSRQYYAETDATAKVCL